MTRAQKGHTSTCTRTVWQERNRVMRTCSGGRGVVGGCGSVLRVQQDRIQQLRRPCATTARQTIPTQTVHKKDLLLYNAAGQRCLFVPPSPRLSPLAAALGLLFLKSSDGAASSSGASCGRFKGQAQHCQWTSQAEAAAKRRRQDIGRHRAQANESPRFRSRTMRRHARRAVVGGVIIAHLQQ